MSCAMSTQPALTLEQKYRLTRIFGYYEYDYIPRGASEIRRYKNINENDIYIEYVSKTKRVENWFDLLEGVELYKSNKAIQHKRPITGTYRIVAAKTVEHITNDRFTGYKDVVLRSYETVRQYEGDIYELWSGYEKCAIEKIRDIEKRELKDYTYTPEQRNQWNAEADDRAKEIADPIKKENESTMNNAKYEYFSLQQQNILNKIDEKSDQNKIDENSGAVDESIDEMHKMEDLINTQLTELRKILFPEYEGSVKATIRFKLARLQQMSR